VLAARQRPELPVDERDQLAREVVGIVADGGAVHVLVAAERGEAVREDEDRRTQPALVHQARGALGNVMAEGLPPQVRESRAGEAHEVVEDREAALAAVVARRQPDAELAHMRVAERVAFQYLGDVLEHDGAARVALGALECHARILGAR
jgi:hypothetical protein